MFASFTKYFGRKKVTFQLAPPHIHRTNAAEQAIHTFKDHLLAGLASVDPNFSMHLWDQLLHQATITLNLLRPVRLNPKLSGHAFLNRAFNYMATPLALQGIRVEIHEKPTNRPSFGYHNTSTFYLGPAQNHYRCYRVYVPETAQERIADTVAFFPARFRMPVSSSLDKATQAAEILLDLLKNHLPALPFFDFGNVQQTALHKLAELVHSSLQPHKKLKPCPTNLPPVTLPRVHSPPAPLPRVHSPPAPLPRATAPPASLPRVEVLQLSTSFQHPYSYNTRLQQQLRQQQHRINSAISYVQSLANPVLDKKSGILLKYRDLIKGPDKIVWEKGMSNELGRLAQGVGTRMPHGTDTIKFVKYNEVPRNKHPTYTCIVSELRPQKPDPFRIRITAGGNLIVYLDDKSQPTSDIVTSKLLLNSVVSTPNAKFLGLDVKNVYLHSELPEPEYMRISQELIPDEIIQQYNLHDYFHNGYLYCKIQKGVYGLPQAGKLAHGKLKGHLKKFDFDPCPITPGLISSLRQEYELHEDWEDTTYIGMTLTWNYTA